MTTALVQYQTQAGDTIKLTVQDVIKYLVSGKRELVTEQEAIFFMATCKAGKTNPFLKECYLIKYSERDPAAIVTSVNYFRKNARKHDDCVGWLAGIIVQKNGELEYREGNLLLDGEKLVGGWSEAQPKGWEIKKRHTVPLKRYIKKTKDGNVTQFWTEDKQPEMISKVAEAQLLRQLWGEEATGMYLHEEVGESLPQLPTPEQSGDLKKQILSNDNKNGATKVDSADNSSWAWDRSNWINLKTTGFPPYVWKYIDSLKDQPKEIIDAVRAKWVKDLQLEEPFPLDIPPTKEAEPETEPEPVNDTESKKQTLIDEIIEHWNADQIKEAQRKMNFAVDRWPSTLNGLQALYKRLSENGKM